MDVTCTFEDADVCCVLTNQDHIPIRPGVRDESNQLQIEFHDSRYYMASQLYTASNVNKGLIIPGQVAADFHESFVNQLKNVIAATRGTESLMVSGEAGLASLRAIESCYSQGAMLDMPWFSELEILRSQQIKNRRPR